MLVDFDETHLTTVVIGQNGAGKSNLIEAIVEVFRFADSNRDEPRYRYEIDYRIGGHKVRLSNREGKAVILDNGVSIARTGVGVAETQRAVDTRNALARISDRTDEEERDLIAVNDKLSRLGFMFEDREPLYQDFLLAWKDVRYGGLPPLTPSQIEARRKAMGALIKELIDDRRGSA